MPPSIITPFRRPSELRLGISLIEAIVVIAVLSTLASLLLIAMQSARESAREVTCASRIRNLAFSIKQFETAHGRLPPGILGVAEAFLHEDNYHNLASPYCWRRFQYTTFLGFLLPYMERETQYAQVESGMFDRDRTLEQLPRKPGGANYQSFLDVASAVALGEKDVPDFRCPSDTLAETGHPGITHVLGALQPVVHGVDREDRLGWVNLLERHSGNFVHGNYAACMGAHSGGVLLDPIKRRFTGLMSSRAPIYARSCRDGLSKTVVIAETIGEVHQGKRTILNSWLFGAIARGRGMVPWGAPPRSIPLLGSHESANFVGFGSVHRHGVQAAYGDGHVELITRQVDWVVWYRLCGMADEGIALSEGVLDGATRREM